MNASPKHPWHIPVIFAITYVIHHLDRNVIAYSLPHIASDFGWSDKQLGEYGQYLLGAFFLTFGLSQIFLSGPAERLGARRVILLAIAGFSIVTIGLGAIGTTLAILIALRLVLGLAESMHVPMMSSMTARIFPVEVRATANSIWGIGLILATALGPIIIVPLMSAVGWRQSFIAVGTAGLVIGLPLVLFFVKDVASRPSAPGAGAAATGGAFRKLPAYWLFVLAGILNAFCGFGILGWLPTYFVRAKGIDFGALGWPLAVVFTSGVIGTLVFARVGDLLRRRITLASLGMALCGVFLYLAQAADGLPALVALFALAVLVQSTFQAQEMTTVQRLAKDTDVAAATGLYNGLSVLLGGVLGSMIPGAIIAATGNYNHALLSIAAAAILGGLIMALLSRRHSDLN